MAWCNLTPSLDASTSSNPTILGSSVEEVVASSAARAPAMLSRMGLCSPWTAATYAERRAIHCKAQPVKTLGYASLDTMNGHTYGPGCGYNRWIKQVLQVSQWPKLLHPFPDVVNRQVGQAGGLGVHEPFSTVRQLFFDQGLCSEISAEHVGAVLMAWLLTR